MQEEKGPTPSVDASVTSVGVDLPDQVRFKVCSPMLLSYIQLQVISFLASRVLPKLRRFLFDNEKVAGICTNVVYYIITPAMKAKSK